MHPTSLKIKQIADGNRNTFRNVVMCIRVENAV
jgi:hypothetical protein